MAKRRIRVRFNRCREDQWRRAWMSAVDRGVSETGLRPGTVMRMIDLAHSLLPRHGGGRPKAARSDVGRVVQMLIARGIPASKLVRTVEESLARNGLHPVPRRTLYRIVARHIQEVIGLVSLKK